jgi:MFS family permease
MREVAPNYLSWTSIVLGAIIATAFSTILISFGTAVGLSIASTSPTWRDASVALWLLSGIYLIVAAAISFGVGGYVSGYIANREPNVEPIEPEHRDGAHGLESWGLAILFGAAIAALASGHANIGLRSAEGRSTANAAEPLLSYEIDRMFRSGHHTPNAILPLERAEAGRILLTSSGHEGVTSEDRGYLVRQIVGTTGIAQPEPRVGSIPP